MPKVQEQGNSIPSSLHYALTDSQCNKCGAQLEWNAVNDINSPKYTARHCGQDYLITIDSVKVELVKQSITEKGTKQNKNSEGEENEKPKAISMAEDLKNDSNKPPLPSKAKLGDGSHIAAEDR
jgi:NAD-dependent SIR2 family protein deacetylase